MSNPIEAPDGPGDRWHMDGMEVSLHIIEKRRRHRIYLHLATLPIRVWDSAHQISLARFWLASSENTFTWDLETINEIPAAYSSASKNHTTNKDAIPPLIVQLLEYLDAFLSQFPGYIHPDNPDTMLDPYTDETAIVWNWRHEDLRSTMERVAEATDQPKRLKSDLLTVDELRRLLTQFFEFYSPLFDPMQ